MPERNNFTTQMLLNQHYKQKENYPTTKRIKKEGKCAFCASAFADVIICNLLLLGERYAQKRSEQLIIYALKDIHLAMGHSIETVILAAIRAEKMAAEVQKWSISSGKFVVWIGEKKSQSDLDWLSYTFIIVFRIPK